MQALVNKIDVRAATASTRLENLEVPPVHARSRGMKTPLEERQARKRQARRHFGRRNNRAAAVSIVLMPRLHWGHACGDSSELIGNVNQHGGHVSLWPLVLTDHGQQSFAGDGRRR